MLGWLGKWAGSKGMAKVPNLIGLNRGQARQALQNSGFNFGNETEEVQSDINLDDKVKSQSISQDSLLDYETSVDYVIYSFSFTPYSFTPYSFTPQGVYSFTPEVYSFTPYSFTPQTYSFTPQSRQCCEGGCTEADIVEIYDSEEICSEISSCEECSYYGGVNCVIFQIAVYCDGSSGVVGSTQGPNHTGPVREPSLDDTCCPGTYSFTPSTYSFTPTTYSFTPTSNNCPEPGPWSEWSACVNGTRTRTRQNYDDVPGCPSYIETETEPCVDPYSFTPATYSFTPYSFTPFSFIPTSYSFTPEYSFTPQYSFTPMAYSFTPYSFTPFSFIPTSYSFTPQYSFTPMAVYSFTPETPYSFTPMAYSFTPYSFTPFSFTPTEGGPV